MCELCRRAGLNEAEMHGGAARNPYLDDAPRIYAQNPIFNEMENFGDGAVVRVWDMPGWFMDILNTSMFSRAANIVFVSESNYFNSDIWFNERYIDKTHGVLGAAFNSSSSAGIVEVRLDIYDVYAFSVEEAAVLVFHELGHATGLAHVRETDGRLSGYEVPYTSHLQGTALMEPYLRDFFYYDNYLIKETAALQYIYGAPAVYVSPTGDSDDVLFARTAGSTIHAGGGDDYVIGREHGAGADVFHGEHGADVLIGLAGGDILHGGNDADTLDGGAGADILYGNKGLDRAVGGEGNDTLYGGQNAGPPRATAGDPEPRMRDGVETLWGGGGDDVLYGNRGSDELRGETGADALYGGKGDDAADGGRGNDALYGDEGNDLLRGGSGDDTLEGGAGADVFHFSEGGADVVRDFDPAEGDRLAFEGAVTGAGAGPEGHLRVHHAGGTVDLLDIAPEQWDPAWALPVA